MKRSNDYLLSPSPHLFLLSRGVEDVDDLMADVHEQMELATEISDAISNPIGFGADDIDEVSTKFGVMQGSNYGVNNS